MQQWYIEYYRLISDSKLLEDYGSSFCQAYRTTHNYRQWAGAKHPAMADVLIGWVGRTIFLIAKTFFKKLTPLKISRGQSRIIFVCWGANVFGLIIKILLIHWYIYIILWVTGTCMLHYNARPFIFRYIQGNVRLSVKLNHEIYEYWSPKTMICF